MVKFQDKERKESEVKAIVDIKRFILFHKRRVFLLKRLLKKRIHGRLIFQISILGLESLGRVLYPNEKTKLKFIKNFIPCL